MDTVLIAGLCVIIGFCGASLWNRWKIGEALRQRDQRILELEKNIAVQDKQLAEFQGQTEQMRAFRHDFRHHVTAIRAYAQGSDLSSLDEYLAHFGILNQDTALTLCANPTVNAMARRYLGAAQAEGVRVDAVLDLGEVTGISVPDLCVVFGNCLENALEAVCLLPPDQREIRVRAKDTPGWLSLVMENTCLPGKLEPMDGGYRSAKAEGRAGMGLMSVRTLAERYGGAAFYQMEDGRFRTSVILFKGGGDNESGDLRGEDGGDRPVEDPSGPAEPGAMSASDYGDLSGLRSPADGP